MKGLIIWPHSECRSTMAFFLELARQAGPESRIFVRKLRENNNRARLGFSNNEFKNNIINFIPDDPEKGIAILEKYRDYHHLFGSYQNLPLHHKLMDYCISNGISYGIASEAPCNMTPPPSRLFKALYINCILPGKVSRFIKNASYIINLSGKYGDSLMKLGWPENKIIECGYYSPPISGTTPVYRTEANREKFTILLSGIHQWHRSPWLLIEALGILRKKGLQFKCYVTQTGPELNRIKELASKSGLGDMVEFLGFVDMERLKELYATVSVYVGAGNHEPWGMRLNDVLQCGAPLIVNEGMGGSLMVDRYGCGLTFRQNDSSDLADKLEMLMTDKELYLRCASNAFDTIEKISPEHMAGVIFRKIQNKISIG